MNAYAVFVCALLATCIAFAYAKPQCIGPHCQQSFMRRFW
ncbi:hypothetical protein OESDEN_21995 [Oesophagostomum dentatum]|uniref:Uncharacterized protein n=1 Tax=Oesophagostomum dentatum TaxID=61180 RepID=A0A0B1S0B3_OESDE|nr:hypothetical protein OESDEN_21995 [Oesophagostomum dentatum]